MLSIGRKGRQVRREPRASSPVAVIFPAPQPRKVRRASLPAISTVCGETDRDRALRYPCRSRFRPLPPLVIPAYAPDRL